MNGRKPRLLARVSAALLIGALLAGGAAFLLYSRAATDRALARLEIAGEVIAAALDAAKGDAGTDRVVRSLAGAGYTLFPPGSRAAEDITGSGQAVFREERLLVVRQDSKRGPFVLAQPATEADTGGGLPDETLVALGAGFLGAWVAAVALLPSPSALRAPAQRRVVRREPEMAPEPARTEREEAFMDAVGRELRSSLVVIADQADLLRKGTADKDDAAHAIQEQTDHLDRFVEDLTDLALLGSGRLAIARKPVDLVEVAQALALRYRPVADARGVAIEVDSAGNNWVLADRDRLMQAAANLVENALRAAPGGSTVTIATEPGVIRLLDEGAGLSPEDEARAFDRFYLYERAGAGSRDGTGLGLALVKELTEAMGGSASAHDRVGDGATFAIKLQSYPESRTSAEAPEDQ